MAGKDRETMSQGWEVGHGNGRGLGNHELEKEVPCPASLCDQYVKVALGPKWCPDLGRLGEWEATR